MLPDGCFIIEFLRVVQKYCLCVSRRKGLVQRNLVQIQLFKLVLGNEQFAEFRPLVY